MSFPLITRNISNRSTLNVPAVISPISKYPIVADALLELGWTFKYHDRPYDVYTTGKTYFGVCVACRFIFREVNGQMFRGQMPLDMVNAIASQDKQRISAAFKKFFAI